MSQPHLGLGWFGHEGCFELTAEALEQQQKPGEFNLFDGHAATAAAAAVRTSGGAGLNDAEAYSMEGAVGEELDSPEEGGSSGEGVEVGEVGVGDAEGRDGANDGLKVGGWWRRVFWRPRLCRSGARTVRYEGFSERGDVVGKEDLGRAESLEISGEFGWQTSDQVPLRL